MPDQDFKHPGASAKSLREGARFAAPTSGTGPNAAPELDPNSARVDRATVTPAPKKTTGKPKKREITGNVITLVEQPEPTELSPAVKAKLLELGHPIPGEKGPNETHQREHAPAPTEPPVESGPVPAALRLLYHFGVWLEEGEHEGVGRLLKYWSEGAIERHPEGVAFLLARKAPVVPHKD
jgi:hypothetical protein